MSCALVEDPSSGVVVGLLLALSGEVPGAGLAARFELAELPGFDCLITKKTTMPTNTSSKRAIAITPPVRIGLDRGLSAGSIRAPSLPWYESIVGVEDFCVGVTRGNSSVAGSSRVVEESGLPSSRQNLSVSSLYSRLHFGQRFIGVTQNYQVCARKLTACVTKSSYATTPSDCPLMIPNASSGVFAKLRI